MQLRYWNDYFLVGEENLGQRSRRKSLNVPERTKDMPRFQLGEYYHAQLLYPLSHIAHHVSESDADRDASREQIRPMENAL
jgi:hypothetical protein